MKNITLITFILIGLCFLIVPNKLIAQEKGHKYEDREKVESNTAKYNPAYFKNQEKQHLILFFDIVDGRMKLSDKRAIIMHGGKAYASKTGGQFMVVTKDQEGKVLSKYFIHDPTYVRLHEGTDDALQPIKSYKNLQIAVPYHKMMKMVELGPEQKTVNFDISAKIRNAVIHE